MFSSNNNVIQFALIYIKGTRITKKILKATVLDKSILGYTLQLAKHLPSRAELKVTSHKHKDMRPS